MGPHPQLSGGNGCRGALCHVNARVLAPEAMNSVQRRVLFLEEETLSWHPSLWAWGPASLLACHPSLERRDFPCLPNQKQSSQRPDLPEWDEGSCSALRTLLPSLPPFLQQSPEDVARSSSHLEPPNAPGLRSPC